MVRITQQELDAQADALRRCTGSVSVTVHDSGLTAVSVAPQVMVKQRLYLNGLLTKTSKPTTRETARVWLDNLQREWSKHLGPLVAPGEFDPNNGHRVERLTEDDLLVVTTGNKTLRFRNVEVK